MTEAYIPIVNTLISSGISLIVAFGTWHVTMKKDRENSVKIYSEAVQNSNSENAAINLNKAQNELKPITLFITQLQASMPRVLSYEETRTYIKGFLQLTPNANIGMVMKHLKTRNDSKFDMQIASAIAKQELAK